MQIRAGRHAGRNGPMDLRRNPRGGPPFFLEEVRMARASLRWRGLTLEVVGPTFDMISLRGLLEEEKMDKRKRPRDHSAAELRRVGVEKLDPPRDRCQFKCLKCGQEWGLARAPRDRMPSRYWHCPGGCNKPERG